MKIDDSVLGVAFVAIAIFLINQLITPLSSPRVPRTDPVTETRDTRTTERLPPPQVVLPRFAEVDTTPATSRRNEIVEKYRAEVAALLERGDYLAARAYLMNRAAQANASGDAQTLGYVLALLGEVSTGSRDLAAAQIFLSESLAAFKSIEDRTGEAYSLMQFGRMHIKSRAIARHAANAYNLLLLSRYQLHHFQYDEAESNVKQVIRASLEIDRYGTAASALETLAQVNRLRGQTFEAENAMFEAAELYAASGREKRALDILEQLRGRGVDPSAIAERRAAIEKALDEFAANTAQIHQARDYRSLYYQYRNAGHLDRAWELRVKAAQTLAQTSKRAMYYRQPDVMAILYNSNMAMDRAEHYIDQASTMFAQQGQEALSQEARDLGALIF
jgi:hypothetical protein